MKLRHAVMVLLLLAGLWTRLWAAESKTLIRDITTVEGVRDNPLIGYGVVVGLKGTGDRQQTVFTNQTLTNILQRMGVQAPAGTIRVNNVAAVFVTATLPPFARPGAPLDVTVSSTGDAKSLEGGLLLLTPLYGPDGKVYAEAQGPVALGGYSAGGGGTSKVVNHPTVGRIPGGGHVEHELTLRLEDLPTLSLLLSEPDFSTAEAVAEGINRELGRALATPRDGGRIELSRDAARGSTVPALLARIENLTVEVHRRAKVVVNERTGTVVLGKDVRLGAVSILHGNLSIEIATHFEVSQPAPLSRLGETTVVPQQEVTSHEGPAKRIELNEGASVEQLVSGLQAIGATARDVIAILQAIKAAGALQAELEII